MAGEWGFCVGDVTPLGQDPATQKQHELVSAIAQTGKFGSPIRQEGSNGQEFLFHCPICIEDDGKGEGHRPHLFVAKATSSGRDNPFYGCRIHDSSADYKRIQKTFISAGIPRDLLGNKSNRGHVSPGMDNSGTDRSAYAEFKSRPVGLGETHPIPEGRIQRWQASLLDDKDSAVAKRVLSYLRADRGLTEATIKAAEFGLAGNKLVLPIRGASGDVVSARYRIIRAEEKPSPWKPYPHPKLKKADGTTPETYGAPTRLYGVRELALDTSPDSRPDGPLPVWVCAGEFDRLVLLECGALSVCSTNGEGSLPRLEDAEFLNGRDIYIVYDCDVAGRKGAKKFAAAATKLGANAAYILDLDSERDDGYDVSDFFRDNDKPDFDAYQELCDRIAVLDPYELSAGTDLRLDEMSDRRMAEIVAERYADELKFVIPSQTWIHWDGKRWHNMAYRDNSPATNAIVATARDIKQIAKGFDDLEFADAVRSWAHNYVNRMHSSAREHITTIPHMRVQLDSLDRLPVLNTPTGILSLDKGTVEPHNPASLLRWMTNGSFVADKSSLSPKEAERFTNWAAFIRRVIPNSEMRRYVQKLLGYSLLDGNPQRLLIFVKGGTSTGKSVFAETVMAALGSYAGPFNMSLLRDNQDEKPRADIVESLTQRIIFASETSSAWHLHADAIKRMTGGDTIKARLPHRGEYFERIPAFTPWVRTNEVPQVTAADMALDRRLVVIPFDQTILESEEDHEAMERLRRESGDAVITWAVHGLRRYRKEGLGDLPVASIEAKFEFSSQLSPMHVFIEDMCERGTDSDMDYRIPVVELYGAYENWCFVNGVKDALNKIEFGRRLTQVGVGTKIDKSVRYRSGIRLKEGMLMK